MSGMQLNTDFSTIKPNEGSGGMFPVSDPKMGWLVKIIDSYPQETRNKDGTRAILKLEGLDQGVMGQVADYGINVANPSQKSVEIGWSELSAVAHVIGVLRVGNTMELHGKPFRVLVRKQKDTEYNEIYGVQDANGNAPGKAGQGPAAAQPAGGGFGGPAGGGGFGPGPGAQPQTQQPAAGGGGNWQPNGAPAGGGNWSPNGGGAADPNATQAQQPGWGAGAPAGGGNGQPSWAAGQR